MRRCGLGNLAAKILTAEAMQIERRQSSVSINAANRARQRPRKMANGNDVSHGLIGRRYASPAR